jgi:6,7-dimethyl-8-ribityllumazine synthase
MLAVSCILAASFVVPPPMARTLPARVASMPTMALKGNDGVSFPEMDGSSVRVGIIKARWHEADIDSLISGVKTSLKECGVTDENVIIQEVPGSFELPLATRLLALSGTVDVIIPIGVLIKGETTHYEVISETVTSSLMSIGLQTSLPVIFGVLTCLTDEQVKARSTGANNHGLQWGKAAVEMALLRKSALGGKKKLFMGFGDPAAEEEKTVAGTPVGSPKKIGF